MKAYLTVTKKIEVNANMPLFCTSEGEPLEFKQLNSNRFAWFKLDGYSYSPYFDTFVEAIEWAKPYGIYLGKKTVEKLPW